MDRWNTLYNSLLDGDSLLDDTSIGSSKISCNQSTTSDMLSLQGGSLVEETSIEERSVLWNGNSFTDPDDLCDSAKRIPGAQAAKELLWETQASCLRTKGEAQEMMEEQYHGAMDRWNDLYKFFRGKSSYQSTTSDMLSLQGSLVEERSIVCTGNNSFTDPDDNNMCHSKQGIPGAEAAKELLWEIQASWRRAKGEAQESIAEFFSEEEQEKRAAQQSKSVKEFKEVGKACKAAVMACGDHADALLAFLLSERRDTTARNDLDITESLTQDYTVMESDGSVITHSKRHVLQWTDDDSTVEVIPRDVKPEIDPEGDDVYLVPLESSHSFGHDETSAEEGRDDPETNYTAPATDIEFIDDFTRSESADDRTPADFPAFASESEESGLDFKQPLSDTLSQDERNINPFTDRGRMVRGNNVQGKIENIGALQRRAGPRIRNTGAAEESVTTQPKSNLSGKRRKDASKSEANDNFDFSEDQIAKLAMTAIAKAEIQRASISDPSKSVIDPYQSHHSRTGVRSYGVIQNPIQHIDLVNSEELIDLTMYDDSNE